MDKRQMDGFEKRKAQKKDSVRRASLELFKTYGFQKVTINEIARRAGVSQVTIYNHFGSKAELMRDVLKWHMLEILEKYRNTMTGNVPFMEKLESIVFDKSQVVGEFQGELLNTIVEEDLTLKAFLEELYINDVMPMMANFFNEGIQQGYISTKISTETILLYFEIIRRGFFEMPDIVAQTQRKPELLKELIQLMTYGLNG